MRLDGAPEFFIILPYIILPISFLPGRATHVVSLDF